jgi:hypothetical protein
MSQIALPSLAGTDRQVERTRRAEAVRLRQRALLVRMIADAMVEFGITQAELNAACRAAGGGPRRGRTRRAASHAAALVEEQD